MPKQNIIRIENAVHQQLTIEQWQLPKFAQCCVIGRNGTGKQFLDKLLVGEEHVLSADYFEIPPDDHVAVISFETMQAVYEHELKIDETDITDVIDDGTQAFEFLPESQRNHPLIAQFSMTHVLNKGFRLLSTGESRKLLILQAVLNHVVNNNLELLICDNPFDSLDIVSVDELSSMLSTLHEFGIAVLLCLSNRGDIPDWCQQTAIIDDGKLLDLSHLDEQQIARQLEVLMTDEEDTSEWPLPPVLANKIDNDFLVKLVNGKVAYNGNVIFENLNFSIKPLQHTLLTGANGCGKSTLLQLITGDHPQCYSNELSVLGFTRGQGETIWDIKKQMGIVSPEIHRQYRVSCDVLTTIVSGFFDSIGVYQQTESWQINIAKQWLAKIGLANYGHKLLSQLSYGEQRLVLIARSLVKAPLLLILDEPTQGIDEVNRHRLLKFLQTLDQQQHSTILFVSHRLDEQLSLFKQHFKM